MTELRNLTPAMWANSPDVDYPMYYYRTRQDSENIERDSGISAPCQRTCVQEEADVARNASERVSKEKRSSQ